MAAITNRHSSTFYWVSLIDMNPTLSYLNAKHIPIRKLVRTLTLLSIVFLLFVCLSRPLPSFTFETTTTLFKSEMCTVLFDTK